MVDVDAAGVDVGNGFASTVAGASSVPEPVAIADGGWSTGAA